METIEVNRTAFLDAVSIDNAAGLIESCGRYASEQIGVFSSSPHLGTYRIRGRLLADRFGYVDAENDRNRPHVKVAWVVKSPDLLRDLKVENDGVTVVYDPLDVFWTNPHVDPVEFWRGHEQEYGRYVDIWVATSPACRTAMVKAGIKRIAMIPHWPDPKVVQCDRDPNGPVVYHGLGCFTEGCPIDFVRSGFNGWNDLRPSAVLCARFGSSNTPLNSVCKPQIKLANAIAAGLPALVGDQAGLSLLA